MNKFKRSNIVLKHTEILHLLLQLSGDSKGDNNGGGVLESVFNNKILH